MQQFIGPRCSSLINNVDLFPDERLFGGSKVPTEFQLRSLQMWLHRGGSTLRCDGARCTVTRLSGYTCCGVDVSTCKRTQNDTAFLCLKLRPLKRKVLSFRFVCFFKKKNLCVAVFEE